MTDPWQILGIEAKASEEEIRTAYLARIKEHPPDSSPEEFERIRDAYQAVRDPRRRVQSLLFAADPEAPFASLVDESRREFTGLGPWLAALKKAPAGRTSS